MRSILRVPVVISLFILLLFLQSGIAQQPIDEEVLLQEGKNSVVYAGPSLYVSELLEQYPSIEVISYTDPFLGTQYGYVNALGGVGRNFLLIEGFTYEIIVSDELLVSFVTKNVVL